MSVRREGATALEFDGAQFRQVLGNYPTGVVLITAIVDHTPIGMIVGSFSSVSLDPPLVSFFATQTSGTFAQLQKANQFSINVLAADQTELCRTFARRGEDKFRDVTWSLSARGNPVIEGVVATVECGAWSMTQVGDHLFVVGEVVSLESRRDAPPLLFFQGGYGRFASSSYPETDGELIRLSHLAAQVRDAAKHLASELNVECSTMAAVGEDVVVLESFSGTGAAPLSTPGSKNPLMPPLGEAFVAYADEDTIEQWVRRASPIDEFGEEDYRARLHRTRDAGWSMAMAGMARDAEFGQAIRAYTPSLLTPTQTRQIEGVISRVSSDHIVPPLVEGESYNVAAITAPIFSADGKVDIAFRLSQFPTAVSAATVRKWIDILCSATAAASGTLK